MYGKYNSDILMELVKTVHQIQNVTTWKENFFVSEMNEWLKNKLAHIHNEFDYSIDTMLFLTTIKEKYVRMHEKFIAELRSYSKAIQILSKGYLPITLITPSKLEAILEQVQIAIAKTNQDYELVLNRLYLYYDTKLVTFGIDNQKNLIIQFPVFVQPYMQTKLTLYQIETVPVPVLDASNKIQSYTQLKIEKPYIALNDVCMPNRQPLRIFVHIFSTFTAILTQFIHIMYIYFNYEILLNVQVVYSTLIW